MKVVILGLDGATWKVLKPLIDYGILPSIKKMVDYGCTGNLESTLPPLTAPAWPCMASGLNPGKLGVFGTLLRRKKNDYTLSTVTSNIAYKDKSFWDILSENEYAVALVKIPFLYPVYEINGCMISGFGSTGKLAVYPKDLYRLVSRGPDEFLERSLLDKTFESNLDKLNIENEKECLTYINQLKNVMQKEANVAIDIANKLPWDLFFYVISMTDWLQHTFMEKIFQLIQKIKTKKIADLDVVEGELLNYYSVVDKIVKQFLTNLNKTGNNIFFLVSDHGFTIRPLTFNIGKWLVDNEYIITKRNQLAIVRSNIIKKTYDMINRLPLDYVIKLFPSQVLPFFANVYLKLSAKKHLNITNLIDFEKSAVYCLDDFSIYINPAIEKNKIIDELINNLASTLKNYNVTPSFFKSDEIYSGSKTELAPDLFFEINDNGNIWEKSTDLNKPLIFKPQFSGIHDRYGIFVAYGPHIRKGVCLNDLKIYDIAPTILHLFNLPIPKDIDGQVISEIFQKSSDFFQRKVRYREKSFKRTLQQRIKELKLSNRL